MDVDNEMSKEEKNKYLYAYATPYRLYRIKKPSLIL